MCSSENGAAAVQHRVREALAGDPGEDPSLGRPVAAWDTTPVGAHP